MPLEYILLSHLGQNISLILVEIVIVLHRLLVEISEVYNSESSRLRNCVILSMRVPFVFIVLGNTILNKRLLIGNNICQKEGKGAVAVTTAPFLCKYLNIIEPPKPDPKIQPQN